MDNSNTGRPLDVHDCFARGLCSADHAPAANDLDRRAIAFVRRPSWLRSPFSRMHKSCRKQVPADSLPDTWDLSQRPALPAAARSGAQTLHELSTDPAGRDGGRNRRRGGNRPLQRHGDVSRVLLGRPFQYEPGAAAAARAFTIPAGPTRQITQFWVLGFQPTRRSRWTSTSSPRSTRRRWRRT